MNAVEIYEKAVNRLERGDITLGEFETQVAVLKDVEPVVRCKDCKAWNKYEPTSVSGRCGYLCRMRMEDDFCSYGERRTDNGA